MKNRVNNAATFLVSQVCYLSCQIIPIIATDQCCMCGQWAPLHVPHQLKNPNMNLDNSMKETK